MSHYQQHAESHLVARLTTELAEARQYHEAYRKLMQDGMGDMAKELAEARRERDELLTLNSKTQGEWSDYCDQLKEIKDNVLEEIDALKQGAEPVAYMYCYQGQDVCLSFEPQDPQIPVTYYWQEPLFRHLAPASAEPCKHDWNFIAESSDRTHAEFQCCKCGLLSEGKAPASAEKDAARYRWLRENDACVIECVVERRGFRSTQPDATREKWTEREGWTVSTLPMEAAPFDSMDAAIDAAMQKGGAA